MVRFWSGLAVLLLAVACNDSSFSGSAARDPGSPKGSGSSPSPATDGAAATGKTAPKGTPATSGSGAEAPSGSPASGPTNNPAKKPPANDQKIPEKIDDPTPKAPTEGCQAFVTGLILSFRAEQEISRVFQVDAGSEWVGSGHYPSNAAAFPRANAATFDGIALDKGTHIKIFAAPNFQGSVVFEGSGPLILNNVQKSRDFPQYFTTVNAQWDPELQAKFPQSTRRLSDTDMVQWGTSGSTIITCD